MEGLIARAMAAWKVADQAAMDAEGLLRVQLLKYAEGISGPPSITLVRHAEELRRASNEALLAVVELLGTEDGRRYREKGRAG